MGIMCSRCSLDDTRRTARLESEGLRLRESSLETLASVQRHPEAAANIVRTLQPQTCCKRMCRFVITLPLLVLVVPVLLLAAVVALLVYIFWVICPGCVLAVFGIEEDFVNAPEWMLPEDDVETEKTFPSKLKGIFYMRLSPMGGDLVCWQKGTWNSDRRSLSISGSAPAAITFEQRFREVLLMVATRLLCFRYEVRFGSSTLMNARIVPKLCCFRLPACVAAFHMADVSAKQDGSLWERWATVLGSPIRSYWAERIMDSDALETPFFIHVQDETPEGCLTFKG